jgi:hypothetical protein
MLESNLIRNPCSPPLRFDVATDNLSDRHGRSPFARLRRLVEILEAAAPGEKTPLDFFALKNGRKNQGEIRQLFQWDRKSSRFQSEIESFLKRKSSRFQSVRTLSEGWWARQDSNLQPDRYEREGRPGKA